MIIPTFEYSLEILLQIIVQKYLHDAYCLTIFSTQPTDLINIKIPTTYITLSPHGDIEDLWLQIYNMSERGCSDFIIQMPEPHKFISAYDKAMHYTDQRRSYRKLIFLPNSDEPSEMYNILNSPGVQFIPNLLLIIPVKSYNKKELEYIKSFDLVNNKFVGKDIEAKLPIKLDQWNVTDNKFDKNANLFPNHGIPDLQGRIVKLATIQYIPFAVIDFDDYTTELDKDGMEVKIVEQFCVWVNCSVTIVRDDDEWGELYPNFTGIGILGNTVEDKADMGVGAIYYIWYEARTYLDFSHTTTRSGVTCLVPAARLLESWLLPLLPFRLETWIALIFAFFICSYALMQAQNFNTKNIFLTTFGMMVTQSHNDPDENWKIRRVMCWLLLIGLVIDNAYGAGLAYTFTVPKYEKPINNINDIVQRKLEWGATQDAWLFAIRLSDQESIISLLKLFRAYPAEELKRRSFLRDMGYIIETLSAGTIAIPDYITSEALPGLSLMKEDLFNSLCVVVLRKNSPYTEKLNVLIGRLQQSGIFMAWEAQMKYNYLNLKDQLTVKLSQSKQDVEEIKGLNLKQIVGIFLLYIAGTILSIIAFIFEITICKKKK